MVKKRIIIDVATIYPGKGGAGGGIWSYAKNLLLHLDKEVVKSDIEVICLVNTDFDLQLQNLNVKRLRGNIRNFIIRLFYIHVFLPIYVYFKRADLHKLYFEAPVFCPSKMLVTIHDCMMDFYKSRNYSAISSPQGFKKIYFDWINRRVIKKSNIICTPSEFVKSELISRYGVPAGKVFATPLATSLHDNGRKPEKGKRASIHFYCIAAFHPHKGHLRLLEIFETLYKVYKADVHLYFRGHIHDNFYFSTVSKKIETLTSRDRIRILNYEAGSTLDEIYNDADWVILLSEYEGFGLPVIEAQAKGIPVICSAIPTFKEVAGDAVLYVDDDPDYFKAATLIHSAITNDDLKQKLINSGFENVSKFSWQQFAQQMLIIYKTTDVIKPPNKFN